MPRVPGKAQLATGFGRGPRLYNAKRKIKTSQPATPTAIQTYIDNPNDEAWREQASQDVVEFIDKAKKAHVPLSPSETRQCLQNPAKFFSKPHNVPSLLRKQLYLPDFVVTFMRTPHLPPKYAQFDVPMWFNKLDMKAYLEQVYKVESIHIRSTIFQGKFARRDVPGGRTRGALYRKPNQKKMTVELVKPFVWPEIIKDLSGWEHDKYWEWSKSSFERQREDSDWAKQNPNDKHRKSIAQQAKELLQGKASWRPTWMEIPTEARVLRGLDRAPPTSPPT